MRVMIDTNVFMSALMFPESTPSTAMLLVAEKHVMVLSDYIIGEIREKTSLKRPDLLSALDELLDALEYEIEAESSAQDAPISDPKDAPILSAAISADVDVIISGDKHFKNLTLETPRVLSPADFVLKYGI